MQTMSAFFQKEETCMSKKTAGGMLIRTAGAGALAYAGISGLLFRKFFRVTKNEKHEAYHSELYTVEDDQWFANCHREDLYAVSYDGLNLHAIVIESHPESDQWMLILHGHNERAVDMKRWMHEADKRGWNVLVPDARGHGLSSGRYTGLGWPEHYDAITWIDQIVRRNINSKIFVYGRDTGANAVVNLLGDHLPGNVKAAAADSASSDLSDLIVYRTGKETCIHGNVFVHGIDFFVKRILHFSVYEGTTRRQLMKAQVPLLLNYGSEDITIPAGMQYDNYYACASERNMHVYHGADHNNLWMQETYFDDLFSFAYNYVK